MAVAPDQVVLLRQDYRVALPPDMWSEMLLFLTKCGWRASVPTHYFLSEMDVSQADALSLATVGKIVLEETLNDPLSACEAISFDMGKFAEVVYFCEEGAFRICQ